MGAAGERLLGLGKQDGICGGTLSDAFPAHRTAPFSHESEREPELHE
jgi:hypothetical protein